MTNSSEVKKILSIELSALFLQSTIHVLNATFSPCALDKLAHQSCISFQTNHQARPLFIIFLFLSPPSEFHFLLHETVIFSPLISRLRKCMPRWVKKRSLTRQKKTLTMGSSWVFLVRLEGTPSTSRGLCGKQWVLVFCLCYVHFLFVVIACAFIWNFGGGVEKMFLVRILKWCKRVMVKLKKKCWKKNEECLVFEKRKKNIFEKLEFLINIFYLFLIGLLPLCLKIIIYFL